MLDLRFIDVAIGIIFLYLLVCMVCSMIRESIETLLNRRGANLEMAVRELFGNAVRQSDSATAQKIQSTHNLRRLEIDSFYEHPLIAVLYPGAYPGELDIHHGKDDQSGEKRRTNRLQKLRGLLHRRNLPSYIPPSTFALALMDLVVRHPAGDQPGAPHRLTIESLRHNLDKIQNTTVKVALQVAIDTADGEIERVRESIETWFNSAMDAIANRYRRNTNWIIFAIALSIAVLVNVDTFRVADYLYRQGAVRDVLVAQATEAAKRDDLDDFNNARLLLESTELPIGWSNERGPKLLKWKTLNRFKRDNILELFSFGIGWLVTALAATLGAPFWFDLLKRFIQARSIIRPPKSAGTRSVRDRSEEKQANE